MELTLLLTRVMRMEEKGVDGCTVGWLGGRTDGRVGGWMDDSMAEHTKFMNFAFDFLLLEPRDTEIDFL